jgi:hypothetical protein
MRDRHIFAYEQTSRLPPNGRLASASRTTEKEERYFGRLH